MLKGIPISRIQSGHSGIKTPEQQRKYGGISGVEHDPVHLSNNIKIVLS
jgi:hypothetical protein